MAGRYCNIARFDKTKCLFSSCMICRVKRHLVFLSSTLRVSLTDPLAGIQASYVLLDGSGEQVKGGETKRFLRNLNRRTAPFERSHCSFRLTRSPHFGCADSPLG